MLASLPPASAWRVASVELPVKRRKGPYPHANQAPALGFQGPRLALWILVRWAFRNSHSFKTACSSAFSLFQTNPASNPDAGGAPPGLKRSCLLSHRISTLARPCFSPTVIQPAVLPMSWRPAVGPDRIRAMAFRIVDLPEAFPPTKTLHPCSVLSGRVKSNRSSRNALMFSNVSDFTYISGQPKAYQTMPSVRRDLP